MGIFDWLIGKNKHSSPGLARSDKVITSTPKSPINELEKQIRDQGHPDFPFLHKDYSPASRIPCTDFTPFLIDRLRANDSKSICDLMKRIIEANPGMGVGTSWISERVHQVIDINFDRFLEFLDPAAIHQLKATWILTEAHGADRRSWFIHERHMPFTQVMCPFVFQLKPQLDDLLKQANAYLAKLKKNNPAWRDYPSVAPHDLIVPPLIINECSIKVRSLSIGARLHLFFMVSLGGGNLEKTTDYRVRSLGINLHQAAKEILDSQLFTVSDDPKLLLKMFKKDDLIKVCEETTITYKRNWTKEKLFELVRQQKPDHVRNLATNGHLMSINPKYADSLLALQHRAKLLDPIFKVLCFI